MHYSVGQTRLNAGFVRYPGSTIPLQGFSVIHAWFQREDKIIKYDSRELGLHIDGARLYVTITWKAIPDHYAGDSVLHGSELIGDLMLRNDVEFSGNAELWVPMIIMNPRFDLKNDFDSYTDKGKIRFKSKLLYQNTVAITREWNQ